MSVVTLAACGIQLACCVLDPQHLRKTGEALVKVACDSDRNFIEDVGELSEAVHKDYLSNKSGKRKEGLRDLDRASMQNKTEKRKQICTGEMRGSSRREAAEERTSEAAVEPKHPETYCSTALNKYF